MIREIKKQARLKLLNNYKLFSIPTILYVFSNFVMMSSLYAFYNQESLFVGNLFFETLFLCLFLFFKLFVLPISIFLLFKTSVKVVNEGLENSKPIYPSSSFKDFGIITLIWLVPNILDAANEIFDGVIEYSQISMNSTLLISLSVLIIKAFLIYLEYKYFACYYYYSLSKGTIKETLRFSFGIMKDRFFKYLLLTLSFIHWYLLGGILSMIFAKLFGEIVFIKFALQSIGCGVYFYLLPYQYIAYTLFIKNISKK